MIYCIYFVPFEGAHPDFPLSIYGKLWPIMLASLHSVGGQLVHITDHHTENWGDSVFRVDVDPKTTVYSRDVAWAEFLRRLPDGEEACMIEPDTVVIRPVPPIAPDHDMVLLRRPEKCIPGGFKLAKKSALPFYERVLKEWEPLQGEVRTFHGDITALHRACGFAYNQRAHTIPKLVDGVRIESRDWPCYGYRKMHRNYRQQVLLQYKGDSKNEMVKDFGERT